MLAIHFVPGIDLSYFKALASKTIFIQFWPKYELEVMVKMFLLKGFCMVKAVLQGKHIFPIVNHILCTSFVLSNMAIKDKHTVCTPNNEKTKVFTVSASKW